MLTVDLILALVVICSTIAGYKKGVMGALCSLLVLVISCFGAFIAMQTMSTRVANTIRPQLETALEQRISDNIQQQTQNYMDSAEEKTFSVGGVEYSLGDLLSFLKTIGIDVEEKVSSGVGNATAGAVGAYASQIAQSIAGTLASILVFMAAFLILYLVLHSLELIMGVGEHLPVLKFVNHLGGGAIGFVTAAILLVVAVTILVRSEILPPEVQSGPVLQLLRNVAASLT